MKNAARWRVVATREKRQRECVTLYRWSAPLSRPIAVAVCHACDILIQVRLPRLRRLRSGGRADASAHALAGRDDRQYRDARLQGDGVHLRGEGAGAKGAQVPVVHTAIQAHLLGHTGLHRRRSILHRRSLHGAHRVKSEYAPNGPRRSPSTPVAPPVSSLGSRLRLAHSSYHAQLARAHLKDRAHRELAPTLRTHVHHVASNALAPRRADPECHQAPHPGPTAPALLHARLASKAAPALAINLDGVPATRGADELGLPRGAHERLASGEVHAWGLHVAERDVVRRALIRMGGVRRRGLHLDRSGHTAARRALNTRQHSRLLVGDSRSHLPQQRRLVKCGWSDNNVYCGASLNTAALRGLPRRRHSARPAALGPPRCVAPSPARLDPQGGSLVLDARPTRHPCRA